MVGVALQCGMYARLGCSQSLQAVRLMLCAKHPTLTVQVNTVTRFVQMALQGTGSDRARLRRENWDARVEVAQWELAHNQ
jgi:hypothetical protein